jgi:hypothetical protein
MAAAAASGCARSGQALSRGKWMGSIMWPAIGTILLTLCGWVLVSFLGKPWLDFRDLKRRVHVEIIYSGNIGGEVQGEVEYNKEALNETVGSLRRLAAEMYAAKASAVRPLAWFFDKRGYNLIKAGAGLIALSNSLETVDGSRGRHRKSIEEALKLPPLL